LQKRNVTKTRSHNTSPAKFARASSNVNKPEKPENTMYYKLQNTNQCLTNNYYDNVICTKVSSMQVCMNTIYVIQNT